MAIIWIQLSCVILFVYHSDSTRELVPVPGTSQVDTNTVYMYHIGVGPT